MLKITFLVFFWGGGVKVYCHVLVKTLNLIPFQDARTSNIVLGVAQDERFFNKLEDDVSRIILQEKRREQYANSHSHEVNTSTEHELVRYLVKMDQILCLCSSLLYHRLYHRVLVFFVLS